METLPRLAVIVLALACARAAGAQSLPAGETKSEIPPIQDNSFLMEEAYNQEEGVVQHINAFQRMRGGDWIATFTQEYPVPRQTHQLSYTIAYQRVEGDTASRSGLGDVALNYRYQLAGSGESQFACAPRVTLLLPTGNEKEGLGSGGVGVQANVAASTVLSTQLVAHTNLGGTYTWSARNARREKAGARGYNAGQSLVWMARADFNVLVEAVWSRQQEVGGPGRVRGSDSFFISPGLRWAFNLPTGLQVVPGSALPIGAGPRDGERSIFLYLSFEHPMWKRAP
jgi:hypothetical protein